MGGVSSIQFFGTCFTVKPLYSEQSRDPNFFSLYGGAHPRGVRYVHAHMFQKCNVHMYIKTDLPNLFDFGLFD